MKTLKKISILLLISSTLIFVFSCKKSNKNVEITDFLELRIVDSLEKTISSIPKNSTITNKKVLVVFGYGYNEPDISKKIIDELDNSFGLEENGGLISTIIYPNDFRLNGKAYVSDLTTMISNFEKDLSAVVILGAPERTHTVFARIQDSWQMDVPFYLVALFPQDDVLGIESTCDFVVETTQNDLLNSDLSSAKTITEESVLNYNHENSKIIIQTIDYLVKLKEINATLEKNNSLYTHVSQMLKENKVSNYIDPETGIQSINHFIVE